MLLDDQAPAGAPAGVDELERGRVELPRPELSEPRDPGSPPPRKPPGADDWHGFPRFRGGGDGLPRWQRIAIMGVMLFLAALAGWFIGSGAAVFARGLEAGKRG